MFWFVFDYLGLLWMKNSPLFLLVPAFLAACAPDGGMTVSDTGVSKACGEYITKLHLKNSSRGGALSAAALAQSGLDEAGLGALKRQGFFSADELALIESGRLEVGARSDVVRCVLGNPAEIKRVSVGLSSAETWIYPGFGLRVDIEKGVVKGWRS